MALHKTDGVDGTNDYPKSFVRLHVTDTSGSRGNSMMVNTGDTTNGAGFSAKIADAEDSPLAFGLADEAWTAAGIVRIQTAGYNDQGTADNGAAISLGDLVGTGTGGGNGRLQTNANWTASAAPFALCVDAFTASTADGVILIDDKGWYGH